MANRKGRAGRGGRRVYLHQLLIMGVHGDPLLLHLCLHLAQGQDGHHPLLPHLEVLRYPRHGVPAQEECVNIALSIAIRSPSQSISYFQRKKIRIIITSV